MKNTGESLENDVYNAISNLVSTNQFLLSEPNVRVHRKKKYYSKDREAYIVCDIVVEKYLASPDDLQAYPALKVIIECKDYAGSIPVDDVEEFHAKLQQIGADNTKGIMITRDGTFQKSALSYAKTKGIAVARLLPNDQVSYILHYMTLFAPSDRYVKDVENIDEALTNRDFVSDCQVFYASTGETSIDELVYCSLGNYAYTEFRKLLDEFM